MCYSAARSTKCLYFVTGSLTVFYWLLLVPFLFESFRRDPHIDDWSQHWKIIYFAIVFLLWGVLMFVIVGIWYLCQNHFYNRIENESENTLVNAKEDMCKIKEVNEKVRQTLGLDEDFQEITKAVLSRKSSQFLRKGSSDNIKKRESDGVESEKLSKTKGSVVDLELEAQITPLPEYSPEAKSTIFDFSETSIDGSDIKRSSSPFQEFLHLVQIESPGTPKKSLEDEVCESLSAKFRSGRGKDNDVGKLNTTEKFPPPIKSEILLKQPPVKKKISIINEVDEEIQNQFNSIVNERQNESKSENADEKYEEPLVEFHHEGEPKAKLPKKNAEEETSLSMEETKREDETPPKVEELPKEDVIEEKPAATDEATKREEKLPLMEVPKEDESINLHLDLEESTKEHELPPEVEELPKKVVKKEKSAFKDEPKKEDEAILKAEELPTRDVNEEKPVATEVPINDENKNLLLEELTKEQDTLPKIEESPKKDFQEENKPSQEKEKNVIVEESPKEQEEPQLDDLRKNGSGEQGPSTQGEPVDKLPKENERTPPSEEVDKNLKIVDISPSRNDSNESDFPKRPKPKLVKKESCMFLGKIGRVGSDVSEMFLDVSKGNAVLDTIIVTGRSQILKGPLT